MEEKEQTGTNSASEKDPETLDLKDLKQNALLLYNRLKENLKVEHLVILFLVVVILVTIADRQHLINQCNTHLFNELEKIRNLSKSLYTSMP